MQAVRKSIAAAALATGLLGAGTLTAAPAFADTTTAAAATHVGSHDFQSKPDPSYSKGYRAGYQQGFRDGQEDCNTRSTSFRRVNQSEYDRGFAEGYNAGHRAACS
jgi:hypothetical protein